MTTGISLVRENTQSMQPPRALWVPFPLGRPLGKPGDADFQRKVIRAALDLLERAAGPVLEDFPVDAPVAAAEEMAACPVSFPQKVEDTDSWTVRLRQEFGELAPWYALSLRRRHGRTLVGIDARSPEKNLLRVAQHLDGGSLPTDVTWLKRAVEDLKAYYLEAMTAEPGDYDHQALQARFWEDTCFGAAVLALYDQYQNADDRRMQLIARILAPREAVGRTTGPTGGVQT